MLSVSRTVTDLTNRNRHQVSRLRRDPRALQAESVIRVNADFAMIVREAMIQNGRYENFKSEKDELTLLDAHNSLVSYLKHVLPQKFPDCFNTNTGETNKLKNRCEQPLKFLSIV